MAPLPHTEQVEGSRNCSPNVLTHLATRKNAQIFKLRCILRGPPFGQLLDSLDVRLQHERDMSGCYGIPLVYVGPQYLLTDHWHLQHKTEILQRDTRETKFQRNWLVEGKLPRLNFATFYAGRLVSLLQNSYKLSNHENVLSVKCLLRMGLSRTKDVSL